MPTALSCKSASALDSLPRNANARRSGTALYRLQQQRTGSAQNHDDFAAVSRASSSSTQLPRRKLSSKASDAQPRRRSNGKAYLSNGVSSNDLPLASSDLYEPTNRGAFSDGEQDRLRGVSENSDDDDAEQSIRVIGVASQDKPRVRASSLSPRKHYQPIMSAAAPLSSPEISPHRSPAPLPLVSQLQSPPSPTKQASPRQQRVAPSRKRVITKDMIGLPTNFQHTGHIGAASYGALPQTGYDVERLRQQLSEVAAALRLDDCGASISTTATAAKTVVEDESKALMEESVVADAAPVMKAAPPVITALPALAPAAEPETPASPSSGLKRTTSKRKPVPAPRKLADLYSEFSNQLDEDALTFDDENVVRPTPVPTLIKEEEEEVVVVTTTSFDAESQPTTRPVPTTLRANGKRLVQGPAGEYITDTANVRWNKALNEITLALKNDEEQDDDADIQQGLAHADSVLRRLNAL